MKDTFSRDKIKRIQRLCAGNRIKIGIDERKLKEMRIARENGYLKIFYKIEAK